jgi:hypothetical protein
MRRFENFKSWLAPKPPCRVQQPYSFPRVIKIVAKRRTSLLSIMWNIEDEGPCSAGADTVIMEVEDPCIVLMPGHDLRAMAQSAAKKKAAVTCESCDARVANTAVCLSGNLKLCEQCDYAEWAAGMCGACGDHPVMPQAQKRCPDQHLCAACDDACDITRWLQVNGWLH